MSEHEAMARAFVDMILKVNKRHGVDETLAVIKYEAAVKAAAKTSKRLRAAGRGHRSKKAAKETA